jgi:hypothetical protein
MDVNTSGLRADLERFLPRDVVGPVLLVFSLEGVIDGVFGLYVPDAYATLGWGVLFVLTSASSVTGELSTRRPSRISRTGSRR